MSKQQGKIRGTVASFSKTWGFITTEDRDFFVHYSNIVGDGYRTLEPGQVVEFEPAKSMRRQDGFEAKNVVVIA